MTSALVEREGQLSTLLSVLDTPGRRGSLVFVFGEAGHGKTSLIGEFVETVDHRYRVLTVECEPLGRPLAFGPLLSSLDEMPDRVRLELDAGGLRPAVYREMADAIAADPTVLIFEDVQWADEATLGLVRHLGKRVGTTSSLVLVSVRPEELDPAHPFHILLSDVGRHGLRVELPPLTVAGVSEVLGGAALDPEEIHTITGGNPFFVGEIARQPDLELPTTVAESITATVGLLPGHAREVVELISLTPDGLEIDGLNVHEDAIDLGCQRRLLVLEGGRLKCRHELIRATVDRSVPPARRRRLHRLIVEALGAAPPSHRRTAQLAFHSREAGLAAEAARYSADAAAAAARAGSHREAARAFGWAIDYVDELPESETGGILRAAAYEHLLVNDFEGALEIARRSVERAANDRERADAEAWLAFFAIRRGDVDLAERSARSAESRLDESAPSTGLARARAVLAAVSLTRGKLEEGIGRGERAVETARASGATAIEGDALITLGTAMALIGDSRGMELIARGGDVSRTVRSLDAAARAMNNLCVLPFTEMRIAEAAERMDEALHYLAVEQLDAWYVAVEVTRTRIAVIRGEWDEAKEVLERVLPRPTCLSTATEALIVEAQRAMRVGEPRALEAIDVALSRSDLVESYAESVYATEVALEAAWLGLVDRGAAEDRYRRAVDAVTAKQDRWSAARLAFWALRLGFEMPAVELAGPVASEAAGHARAAAEQWRKAGFVVEAALTEAFIRDCDLYAVIGSLDERGFTGVAAGLRRQLRGAGVTHVPRPARRATDAHPARLTARQQEVLSLVAVGYTNDAIAEELFISPKTVSHHVSAILTKLGVDSRVQATSTAHINGWV